jgi:hypothetical protein
VVQPTGFQTTLVGGYDGTALQALKTDQVGALGIAGGSAIGDGGKAAGLGIGLQGAATQSWPVAVGTMFFDGTSLRYGRVPSKFVPISAVALVAGTGATIWTPAAGKKIRLMGGWFSSSVAAALILGDNAVGTVIFPTPVLAAAGIFTLPPLGNGQLLALANNVLKLDCTAGTTVTGCVFGTEE